MKKPQPISAPIGPRVSPGEEGEPTSKICILAEAPATQEMQEGRPLVGEAGRVFTELCHQAGIIRRELYIVNVFPFPVEKPEKPTKMWIKGDMSRVLWTQKSGLTDEGWVYAKDAIKKIRASGANVIVALGGTALSALLPRCKSISKYRGSVMMTDVDATGLRRKVVPTYHPAALTWGAPFVWRYDIISDLRKAKRFSSKRALDTQPFSLIIQPSFKDCLEFIRACKEAKLANTDLEVYRPWISCLSLAYHEDEAICIPFVQENGQPYFDFDQEIEIWKAYTDLMGDPDVVKINQNMLFDAWVMFISNHILVRGRMEDPMIMQGILHPDFPKSLQYLTSICTDMEYYKDDKKLWKNFWKDIASFWRYNAKDSIASLRSFNFLNEDIDSRGYRQQYEDYLEDCDHLLYMMCRGVRVDEAKLIVTKKHVQGLIEKAERKWIDKTGEVINIGSNAQLMRYFYVKMGHKPYFDMKTKKPTVNDYALQRMKKKLPEAGIIQEFRAAQKLHSTYLKVEYDEDLRIRTTYNPARTTTGRLSSKKTVFETGMNMQNLDPEFKHFIVP